MPNIAALLFLIWCWQHRLQKSCKHVVVRHCLLRQKVSVGVYITDERDERKSPFGRLEHVVGSFDAPARPQWTRHSLCRDVVRMEISFCFRRVTSRGADDCIGALPKAQLPRRSANLLIHYIPYTRLLIWNRVGCWWVSSSTEAPKTSGDKSEVYRTTRHAKEQLDQSLSCALEDEMYAKYCTCREWCRNSPASTDLQPSPGY